MPAARARRQAARNSAGRRNLFAIERDHAGGTVLSEELDEIGAFEAGLVAGRDHVAERKAEAIGGALEVAEQAATLPDEGNTSFDVAPCLACEQHVQPHAVDVVRHAEAIGSHDRKSGRPRGGGDGVLCRLITDLSKAGSEYHRRADLAARTGLDRFVNAGSRQREDSEVHALGQFVRALEHRPAIDRFGAAANQMDVALEVIELERLQDHLARAPGARRHSDDSHRSRSQEPGDGLGPARGLQTGHAVPLSGWNMSRCVPSSSGCQYGFTFMPIFSSSALQLTMLAMKLTPTSSVTLTTA